MPREFKLPDVGEGVHEGELIEWLVEPGDTVAEDQPIAKVETDKALVDVPASVNGTVRELRWEEGDIVPVGEVLLVFNVEGEDDQEETVESTGGSGAESASEPAADSDVDGEPATTADPASESASPPPAGSPEAAEAASAGDSGRVFAAPSARRLARELGVEIESIDGSGPGGRISESDVRAAAESAEEAAAADTADAGSDVTETSGGDDAGIETAVEAGVEAGGSAGKGKASSEADDETGTTSEGASTAAAQQPADRERTLAAPATRRLAEEQGIDLDAVPATEERDGEPFVTPEAVQEYADAQQQAQAADADAVQSATGAVRTSDADAESASADATGTATADRERPERREPYRGVRRSIGEAMAESKYTAPHVTHHDEVDVTQLVETKERLAERAEERGIKLTYMPFVLKAVVAALKEYPTMNAALDKEAEEIVYREFYDLGIATATDAGLMVPVLEAVDEKGILQLASELDELVEKTRERTISPEELRGSTFTVTNVGAIGGEYATPILNYPEVGILALGQIRRKPRVVEREGTDGTTEEAIEPRSILPLSLSIDHRVVDGAIAAHFTNAVMEYLEDPELLLLE